MGTHPDLATFAGILTVFVAAISALFYWTKSVVKQNDDMSIEREKQFTQRINTLHGEVNDRDRVIQDRLFTSNDRMVECITANTQAMHDIHSCMVAVQTANQTLLTRMEERPCLLTQNEPPKKD